MTNRPSWPASLEVRGPGRVEEDTRATYMRQLTPIMNNSCDVHYAAGELEGGAGLVGTTLRTSGEGRTKLLRTLP